MPAIDGVRLATAAAGIRYRAAPTCCSLCSTRARRSPACSRARNARRRRSNGAARKLKGGKARALVVNSGNANAFTGKTGRAATKFTAEHRRQGGRLQAGRGVPRLDRRDRRAARRGAFDGVMDGLVARRQARRLARRRQGDHDHRYLSEGRDRDARSSARPRSPSTASPRAPA